MVRARLFRAALILAATAGLAAGCASMAPTAPPASVATPATGQENVSAPVTDAVPPAATAQSEEVLPPTVVSLQEFVERNDDKLLQAYVGMSRQNIERLMGNLRAGAYSNPFRQQSVSLTDGKRYDVLYYLTRAPRAGQGISETMLTPVILKNDKIVAIGRYPLKKLRRGECPGKPSSCQ